MNLITLDFETFWSTTHTLSKMNPFEYVMHPETELISLALKVDDSPTAVVFGEDEIRYLVSQVDWSSAMAIAHNMEGFDALILSWRLGVNPKLWACTLAMARPIHANVRSLSLASLVEYYGIGVKDKTALISTRGKHLADFTPSEIAAMGQYNCTDTDQCRELFRCLRQYYTAEEFWHMDCKIRGMTDPKIMLDTGMLTTALAQEREQKREILLGLAELFSPQVFAGVEGDTVTEDYVIERVRQVLASAPMFCQVLEEQGVPVPMKPSPSDPTRMIPALAKTDQEFLELQDHPDPVVAAAASARLAVKSTIAETRMQAFLDAAEFTRGHWPVTIRYCGAVTGRPTGWHYNPLNLPRVNPKHPKITDALRNSLIAPKGCVFVVEDSSNVELRFNHFLWQVPYSTKLWLDQPDADFYRASAALNLHISPEEVTTDQRQASKVENLALQYGMGAAKYVHTAWIMGGLTVDPSDAEDRVRRYRQMHLEIRNGWRSCDTALRWIFEGMERPIDPAGLLWTCTEGIRLPSGRLIRYPALRREDDSWVYGTRGKTYVYGGKTTENCVQAACRDIVYHVAYNVFVRTGYRPSLEVYDELVYIIPESEAEDFHKILREEMRRPVSWFPVLPLWSEGGLAYRYGEAK